MKCNQSRPRFELVSPCPFPATITIIPGAPPWTCIYVINTYIYMYSITDIEQSFCINIANYVTIYLWEMNWFPYKNVLILLAKISLKNCTFCNCMFTFMDNRLFCARFEISLSLLVDNNIWILMMKAQNKESNLFSTRLLKTHFFLTESLINQ